MVRNNMSAFNVEGFFLSRCMKITLEVYMVC